MRHDGLGGQVTQSGRLGLLGRDAQRHFFVVEGDDKDFKRVTGDFLGFNSRDLAHAMGGVDDLVAYGEVMTGEGEGVCGHCVSLSL